jgi:glycosyltransferase involved in cell wall biosynthesis
MDHDPFLLGLPWRLPHYRMMNGPHPVVDSFVRGNAAVRTVDLASAPTTFTAGQMQDVVLNISQQTRQVPPAQAEQLVQRLYVPDQFKIEAHTSAVDALFLHTAPLYAGTRPWIFHFESLPTLFMPFMLTGFCAGLDLAAQDYFALVRMALESPRCLRIFSHIGSSIEILNRTFDSPAIAKKASYVPLGITPLDADRALAAFDNPKPLRVLFTNSLHNDPRSFYLRGGHLLLEAVLRARPRVPNLKLTVVSSVPEDLMQHFTTAHLADVDWIDTRVDDATLERLLLDHHMFALPAAGLHSYSILRALSYGCVPIVSDAFGYEEYTTGIEDSVLRIKGVRDLVYRDEPAGWVSDDYRPYLEAFEPLVRQIENTLVHHADPRRLRTRAERNMEHCRRRFSLTASQVAFNRMLPRD